jgi:cytochrome c-type biogenesis protein CcmH
MSYIYFFLIIFIPLYAVLADKDNFFKFNIKIIIAGLVTVSSLLVYKNILSDGSLELAYQKQSLEIFLGEDQQEKENEREQVNNLITQLVEKRDIEPGELYILARQLKNINEFMLSRDLYKEIYNRFGNDLDGEVVAEYAQVLFMSEGRKFNDSIYILLEEAVKKNPNNPSALTLKGLAELEKSNPQLTIQLWNQAIPLLNSEKEKDDLRSLIEAVKKRKNQ